MSKPRIVYPKPVKKAKRHQRPKKPGIGFAGMLGVIVLLLVFFAVLSHLSASFDDELSGQPIPMSAAEALESGNRIAEEEGNDPIGYTREMQEERELLIARLLAEKKPLKEMIRDAAKAEGIPPRLLHALVLTESGGNPKAISPKGACGLTQLMPATAKELGVKNCRDPHQNLRGGARYLRQQWDRFGDPVTALVAYNFGPGNTEKWRARGARWRELPEETRRYVPKINARMELASLK